MTKGEQAYRLHTRGNSWREVAQELGYPTRAHKGTARHIARKYARLYGLPWPPFEVWPGQYAAAKRRAQIT